MNLDWICDGGLRVYRASGLTTLRVDPAGATLDARLATLGRLMDVVKAS